MRNHIIFYGSHYNRGLEILLKLWPKILNCIPDAQLHICYGWDTFISGDSGNPDNMLWANRMNALMNQSGITHHGRVGKSELHHIRAKCGIWAYPTNFPEINCITALECQRDGLVPITMNRFALKETVGSGFLITGRIRDASTQSKWLRGLFSYMTDYRKWKTESRKAVAFAKKYSWDTIAQSWAQYFT